MTKGFERFYMDRRLRHLQVLMVALLALLIGGLFHFQVLKGDQYVELASRNRLRVMRISPPRGIIRDANGVPLAVNVRTFDLKAYPMDLARDDNLKRVADLLSRKGIPVDQDSLAEEVEEQYVAPYRAVSLARNLTLAQVVDLMGEDQFRGLLFPMPVWRRVYPSGELAAHVVGYVGEITRDELEDLADPRYRGGDMIGKIGIEAVYEEELRGEVGEEAVEVDSRGRKLRDVSHREPKRGKDITLTLDLSAQRLASELMAGQRGAVVAMDVRDGSVKVLFSSPSFDPNPISWGISSKEWGALMGDRQRPMMNRAVSGTYPPASTFKVVTAIAALEEGVVTQSTTVYCPGSFTLGNRTFNCWKKTGHGTEDLTRALRDSCDVYFYQVGVWLGIDRLLKWSSILGVGERTGVDLTGEVQGNIAGPKWKSARFKEPWYKGDTVNYSIGQGFLLMTPIQVLRIYAAIANGGYLVTPHLNAAAPHLERDLRIPKFGLRAMQRGLEEVVNSGTGKRAAAYGVTVAGKTGTAQNPHGDDHAWFVGYAPRENPRYVAVAIVEAGGHGSSAAAPIVGQVLAYLVKNDNSLLRRVSP
jgi:penicillin-binding protein 2